MLRLLADENLNDDIVTGLLLRRPDLNIVRVPDVGLTSASDPDVLTWAAENDRIFVTHDRATMPDHAFERLIRGEHMPGLFVISSRTAVRIAIEELLLIDECSTQSEWSGLVVNLPI